MKIVITGQEAKKKLKAGVNKLNDVVKHTLGPKGKTVVLGRELSTPQVIDDGAITAREMELEDEVENAGLQLAVMTSEKTNRIAGDGTTTSIVLANAFVNELIPDVVSFDTSPVIKQELEGAKNRVLKYLDENKILITSKEQVAHIATISSGDAEVGQVFAEIYEKLGSDCVISHQEGRHPGISYEVTKGMEFDKGMLSPFLATDLDKVKATLKNPYILVTDREIQTTQQILNVLQKATALGPVVIICDGASEAVLNDFFVNAVRSNRRVVPIKAPFYGDRKKDFLEDIAILTGTKVYSEFDALEAKDLGQADLIDASMYTTLITGGKGNQDEIKQRATQLKVQMDNSTSDFENAKLKERIAKLNNGVAVIKVGGYTEAETKNRLAKVEDAVNAVRVALEEGIVEGGGVALYKAADIAGNDVLKNALKAPYLQIVENAGQFDTENLVERGIIDPVKVTKTALNNALSIALQIYSAEAVVVPKNKKDKDSS